MYLLFKDSEKERLRCEFLFVDEHTLDEVPFTLQRTDGNMERLESIRAIHAALDAISGSKSTIQIDRKVVFQDPFTAKSTYICKANGNYALVKPNCKVKFFFSK